MDVFYVIFFSFFSYLDIIGLEITAATTKVNMLGKHFIYFLTRREQHQYFQAPSKRYHISKSKYYLKFLSVRLQSHC